MKELTHMALTVASSLSLQQRSMEDSGSHTLTLLELKAEYPATEKSSYRRKNRNRGEKTHKRKHLLFYGNYLQGDISQGVYLQAEEESSVQDIDEITNSPFDDEVFEDDDLDLHFSNRKRGCQTCRSVDVKRTKPKIKPHKKVKVADKNKSTKTKQNVSENACARKDNNQKKLDKAKVVRFGYGIYHRCAAIEGKKMAKSTRVKRASLKCKRKPKEMVDHPNALKYELKSDNINKGDRARMNKIAELQHRDITPEDFELLLILDESVAPKTVSTNFLQSLTVIVVEEAKILGELCSICMEIYQASEKAKRLPCNHMFHVSCIDNWLSNASLNCPLDGVPVEI